MLFPAARSDWVPIVNIDQLNPASRRFPMPSASKRPGELRHLFRALFLRPYGDNLLTPAARIWLIVMLTLVATLATSEGLIWGVLLHDNVSDSNAYRTPIAVIAGIVIAAILWWIDSTLAGLNFARSPFTEQRVTPSEEAPSYKRFAELILNRKFAGLLFRSSLVAFSIFVTAPILSALLLQDDIDAEIERRNGHERNKAIDKGISALNGKSVLDADEVKEHVKEEKRLIDEIEKRNKDLELEIGGTGTSKAKGRGPVAISIENHIAVLKGDLATTRREKTNSINTENLALEKEKGVIRSAGDDVLRDKYGAELLDFTASTRQTIQEELSARENAFKNLALMAKVLLGMIFAFFLLLKLIQPDAIKIYLDEQLQYAWNDYLDGRFDELLRTSSRSTATPPMSTYEFRDFFYERYPAMRSSENFSEKKQWAKEAREDVRRKLQNSIDDFTRHAESAQGKILRVEEQLASLRQEETDIQLSLERLRQSKATTELHIEKVCETVQAAEQVEGSILGRQHDRLTQQLLKLSQEHHMCLVKLATVQERIGRTEMPLAGLRAEFEEFQRALHRVAAQAKSLGMEEADIAIEEWREIIERQKKDDDTGPRFRVVK
ncbi:MAG: DUF4407 domain-containing protein [Myxococcota bacterium]